MAGDWIKMRCDLQSHPKVVRILSATKADKFRVIGGLHAVWSVFDAHSTDGMLPGYTPDLMDHIIGWAGFSDAMIAVGWLLFDGTETLKMPDFTEHNGKSGKRRAEDQKRKRDGRKAESNPEDVQQSAESLRTENGLEKRREEKSISLSITPITSAKKSDRIRKPKPDAFAMTLDWSPSVEFEKNLPPNLITTPSVWLADIAEFRAYRISTEEKFTQSEWEHKYLQNLEANKKHRGQA